MSNIPQSPRQPHEIYKERLREVGIELDNAQTAGDVLSVLQAFVDTNMSEYILGLQDLDESSTAKSIKLQFGVDANTSVKGAEMRIPLRMTVTPNEGPSVDQELPNYKHEGSKGPATHAQNVSGLIDVIAEHMRTVSM